MIVPVLFSTILYVLSCILRLHAVFSWPDLLAMRPAAFFLTHFWRRLFHKIEQFWASTCIGGIVFHLSTFYADFQHIIVLSNGREQKRSSLTCAFARQMLVNLVVRQKRHPVACRFVRWKTEPTEAAGWKIRLRNEPHGIACDYSHSIVVFAVRRTIRIKSCYVVQPVSWRPPS